MNTLDYKIEKIEDYSIYKNGIYNHRYKYCILVKDHYTNAQLESIASEILVNAKRNTPFSAVMMSFSIEYPNNLQDYLGSLSYAPKGSWKNYRLCKDGEYEVMEWGEKVFL